MVKNLLANAEDAGSVPGLILVSWRRKWQAPVFLPGKFHGQRSLVGYIVHGVAETCLRDLSIQATESKGFSL